MAGRGGRGKKQGEREPPTKMTLLPVEKRAVVADPRVSFAKDVVEQHRAQRGEQSIAKESKHTRGLFVVGLIKSRG